MVIFVLKFTNYFIISGAEKFIYLLLKHAFLFPIPAKKIILTKYVHGDFARLRPFLDFCFGQNIKIKVGKKLDLILRRSF